MKNEGVTILQIVITVVIMLILATIAVLSGRGIPREARIAGIYTEIREIESAINDAKILGKITVSEDKSTLNLYDEITLNVIDKAEYADELDDKATGECYLLDFTSSRKLLNVLELENIKNNYILDYDNLNIYLINGIDISEENTTTVKYNSDDIEAYYMNTFKR